MSNYEVRLRYAEVLPGEDGFPGQVAHIVARDPLTGFEFPISHQCMSHVEVGYEVERIKKALDKVKAPARRKFERHSEKVAASRDR